MVSEDNLQKSRKKDALVPFSKRLQEIIDFLKIDKATFSSLGGIGPSTLYAYLGAESQPSQDILGAWVEALGVNATWLVSGKGPMLIKDDSAPCIRRLGPYSSSYPVCVLGPDNETVGHVVDVLAMTGAGPARENGCMEVLFRVCVPDTFYSACLRVYRVDGDSMHPVVRRGAFVGVDISANNLVAGEIYVIQVPYEGLVLKRVFYDPEKDRLVLRSENTSHPDQFLPTNGRDDLIVGRAVWVMQGL